MAVVMTVLMVTGTLAPAAAAARSGESTPVSAADPAGTLDGNWTAPDDNRTALDYRLAVYRMLDEADAQRHLDALNATFAYVIDQNRVNASRVFQTDKRIVARTQADLPAAADRLTASDRALAETAVADARRVREEMTRRNLSYNETAVEDELANASAALQQGHDHQAGNASLVAAVEAYHRAWRYAQRAMDRMQAAVQPQVEITRREDQPHDGSVEYTVEGVVWDVRSHRMTGTLTINIEDRDLTLDTSTVPGENVSFATTVTLDEPLNLINVTVSNPVDYVDYSRQPAGPGGPGGPGRGQPGDYPGQHGHRPEHGRDDQPRRRR